MGKIVYLPKNFRIRPEIVLAWNDEKKTLELVDSNDLNMKTHFDCCCVCGDTAEIRNGQARVVGGLEREIVFEEEILYGQDWPAIELNAGEVAYETNEGLLIAVNCGPETPGWNEGVADFFDYVRECKEVVISAEDSHVKEGV